MLHMAIRAGKGPKGGTRRGTIVARGSMDGVVAGGARLLLVSQGGVGDTMFAAGAGSSTPTREERPSVSGMDAGGEIGIDNKVHVGNKGRD